MKHRTEPRADALAPHASKITQEQFDERESRIDVLRVMYGIEMAWLGILEAGWWSKPVPDCCKSVIGRQRSEDRARRMEAC